MSKKKKPRVRSTDKYETYQIGTCENCHKENVKIRPIEAVSWMSKSPRGWYKICFECFGPRVTFRSRGQIFHSPTNIIQTSDGPAYLHDVEK